MRLKAFFFVSVPATALGFTVGYFVAAPLRGALIVALQPLLANPATVAALIAALLAFVAGVLGPLVTYLIGRKQAKAAQTSAEAAMMNAKYAGTRALANVRLEWLNDLRDTLSKYHSILMEPKDAAADDRELSYLGRTKLDMLLNQKKKYQQALWQVSDDILNLENPTDKDYDAADKRLVEAARVVLDFHWRKIQAEIMGEAPLKEPPVQGADA